MQYLAKLAALLGAALALPALCADLTLHGGGLRTSLDPDLTYSWAIEYRQPISDHFSGGFIWLNEGHITGHHRDGQSVQLWWHTAPVKRGAVFEVGIGPYYFYDTDNFSNPSDYIDSHGWGALLSGGVRWYFGDHWFGALHVNRVQVHNTFDSTGIVAGIGYRFDEGKSASSSGADWKTDRIGPWEMNVMAGAAVANDLRSQQRFAKALSLFYRASEHVSGSLMYLDEGDTWGENRNGFAAQAWLQNSMTERFSVGLGVGPYFLTNRPLLSNGERPSAVSAMISITAAYTMTPRWVARFAWNRISTNHDRDADVLLFGVGYRF